jgi:IclR family transcriptional regulator, KDG regulon repressor
VQSIARRQKPCDHEAAVDIAETNSLQRALAVLDVLERTHGGLNNAELSRQMGIPKSTVSYITARLTRAGYLIRDEETRRFRMGLKVVALAYGALREVGIRSVAEPVLYKLVTETGLSAGVGVLQQGRVLLIDRVESPGFIHEAVEVASISGVRRRDRYIAREQRDVGRELPAHSTALGKVLLAHLPKQQMLALLAETGLPRRTTKTIISKSRLLQELEIVHERGFATADQEEYAGVRALSAPIVDGSGAVRAAVSVNGNPAERVWGDLPELVKLVQSAARAISRQLRY